jgi:hypothetical protein
MSDYSLEASEYFYRLTCTCCGTEKNRVWGFVSKNGDAHAVYYALLNVTEQCPRVGMTLSVGPWWDDTETSQRSWVHIDICAEDDKVQLVIRDPKESNFYPWTRGGTPLNPEQASVNTSLEEFRSVTNFVVETDPAISSYLSGAGINMVGRELRDAEQPQRNC